MLTRPLRTNSQVELKKLFDEIVALAIDEDVVGLRTLENEGYNINLVCENITPVWKLAFDGHDSAVNLLVNNFYGEKSDAMAGYVAAGDEVSVERLLEQGVHPKYAAQGYAIQGRSNKVNEMHSKGAKLEYIALGYAIGGWSEHLGTMIDIPTCTDQIIFGYAYGGHVANFMPFLNSQNGRKQIIYGLAKAGRHELLQPLLTDNDSIEYAVKYYARGNYIEQANHLAVQLKTYIIAAKEFACQGNFEQVNHYLSMLNIRYGGTNDAKLFVSEVTKAYVTSNVFRTPEDWLRLSAFTSREELKKQIAKIALGKAASERQIRDHFVISTRIERLMHIHKLNFQQALTLTTPAFKLIALDYEELLKLPTEMTEHILTYTFKLQTKEVDKVKTAAKRSFCLFEERREKKQRKDADASHSAKPTL